MMKTINCFTKLRPYAELKKVSSKKIEKSIVNSKLRALQNARGGGLGTIFIGLAAILLAFIIFINIADYLLFTYKRNAISKAMDYSVTAAVQQINKTESIVGLANGFAEETGERALEEIEIDIDMAIRTFLTVFYSNYEVDNHNIDNSLLVCTTSIKDGKLNYTIKANSSVYQGTLENSALIEEKINQAIVQCWANTEEKSQVYINGNPKTNMLENGTYLFAFINAFEIKGLYSQRKISLSSFAGAKLER